MRDSVFGPWPETSDPELAAELLRKRGIVPPHEVVR